MPYRHHYNSYPLACFHIYHLIARCAVHGRCPLDEKKQFCFCFQDLANVTSAIFYTRKDLVMIETSIAILHTSFYIPEIKNLAFHLPHVRILGTDHCGDTRCEAFKCCSVKQDVLCRRDYAEIVVASFAHQIQYEYYGGNISVSIEGIALEHFSPPTHTDT